VVAYRRAGAARAAERRRVESIARLLLFRLLTRNQWIAIAFTTSEARNVRRSAAPASLWEARLVIRVPVMDAWLVYLVPAAMILVALSAHYLVG